MQAAIDGLPAEYAEIDVRDVFGTRVDVTDPLVEGQRRAARCSAKVVRFIEGGPGGRVAHGDNLRAGEETQGLRHSRILPGAIELFLGLALVAAVTDWRRGEIPNWLTLPPLVLAPAAFALFVSPGAALVSIAGIFICGLVPYLLFRQDAIGGGDVKMVAAIGGLLLPAMPMHPRAVRWHKF